MQEELGALSLRYGHKHPKMIALTQALSDIQAQTASESRAIMLTAQREMAHAESLLDAEKSLQNNVEAPSETQNDPTLDALQEFVQETTELLRTVSSNINKTHTTIAPAQVVARAAIPQHPSAPNKSKILLAGTSFSFLLGVILALLTEKMRHTFLSGRQLEEYLGLSCYALIPKTQADTGKNLSDYVIHHPESNLAESIRALRLSLKLHAEKQQSEKKVITLTSSLANEGKTTLSCWLARLAAKSGERVILIDADLRRPSVHKYIGVENTQSLTEYLTGQAKIEDIIHKDKTGLHMIYGRSVPASALEMLSSNKMDHLIRDLRKNYDLILIDSPACMAVADARALEKYSDHILYTVSWNNTPRETVHNGISQFINSENTNISTVLTNIDLKKHAGFGYGDVIHHYGDYKEYTPA